jgi:hypothetical protein
METISGTVLYQPPAPSQTRAFLEEANGSRSLLIRLIDKQRDTVAGTANHLYYGKHKGNNAPLEVQGERGQSGPSQTPTIFFTQAQ